MCLPPGEGFGGQEILQVPVISYHIDWGTCTFEVVTPMLECIVYCREFLVLNVIVGLHVFECPGVECNWVKVTVQSMDGQDCSKGIVRGVSFYHDGGVWDPVCKYWGHGESFLQFVEGFSAVVHPVPGYVLP